MKKLLFKKTTVQLTGVYLLVLMIVSLLFSTTLYRVLGTEIDRNYVRTASSADRFIGFRQDPMQRKMFLEDRLDEHDASKSKLVGQLVFINVIILSVGGFLSYALARRTLAPIEEAHVALERFTADASHELRTPLATMKTEIEVALMNDKLDPKQAKLLLVSNLEEVDRLTHLSERLLLLASLDEDSLPKENTSVGLIISKAVDVASSSANAKNINILTKLPMSPELFVIGDESSLTEMVVILLDNAIKYSKKDTNITVKVVQDNKFMNLSVSDQGVGISNNHLPHIFDRFYRADTSRTGGNSHGYGLGLALAQKIAHMHDGQISVTSKEGKGSTFKVSMPLA